MPPSDTDPKVEALLLDGYRRMPGWQKLERMCAMNRMARELATADVRRRYPSDTEGERKLRVASRWLPAELMRRAFDWDPDREGL